MNKFTKIFFFFFVCNLIFLSKTVSADMISPGERKSVPSYRIEASDKNVLNVPVPNVQDDLTFYGVAGGLIIFTIVISGAFLIIIRRKNDDKS